MIVRRFLLLRLALKAQRAPDRWQAHTAALAYSRLLDLSTTNG